METTAAFDLNDALHGWRGKLAESSAISGESLNELESHLRDSIARLQATGLSDEETFLIASKRIGTNRALGAEFGKVNGSGILFDRLLWILIAFQVWRVLLSVSAVATAASARFTSAVNGLMPGFGYNHTSFDISRVSGIFGSAVLLALAGFSIWWFFAKPRSKGHAHLATLLQRPVALSVALFFTLLLASIARTWSLLFWYFPLTDSLPSFARMGYHDFTREVAMGIPALLVLSLLTFFVARKRLGLINA